jgi:hypothetical protein
MLIDFGGNGQITTGKATFIWSQLKKSRVKLTFRLVKMDYRCLSFRRSDIIRIINNIRAATTMIPKPAYVFIKVVKALIKLANEHVIIIYNRITLYKHWPVYTILDFKPEFRYTLS